VQVDHALRPGGLVQPVDVLGDDAVDEPAALELGEREVAVVGAGASQQTWLRAQ
jgi:hypothetical protein